MTSTVDRAFGPEPIPSGSSGAIGGYLRQWECPNCEVRYGTSPRATRPDCWVCDPPVQMVAAGWDPTKIRRRYTQ